MEPETQEGWLILDGRGRRWDSHLYPTKAAAQATASACITEAYRIRQAKRVVRMQQITTTLARPIAEWILAP